MKLLEHPTPPIADDACTSRQPVHVIIPEARHRERVRRIRVGLVVVMALAAGGVAGGLLGGGARTPKASPAPPAPDPVFVDGTAWRGHGDLAFVSRGHLDVLGNDGTPTVVTGPPSGADTNPSWSSNGQWLAFLNTAAGSELTVPAPTLWVVHVGHSVAREVTTAGVGQFAWSPTSDVLAFTAGPNDAADPGSLWTDAPGAAPSLLAAGPGIGVVSWTSRGTRLAFDDDLPAGEAHSARPTAFLATIASTGGRPHVVYRQPDGTGLRLAGWWPGGGGLLFWLDAGNSASLEATGLSLYSLATGSGAPDQIATSLTGQQWLVPSPNGTTVAVDAGGGRTLWTPGRDVARCRFPSGRCQTVAVPAGTVGLAPEWTPSGGLLYTVAAAAPGGLRNGYAPRSIARQDATSTLYYLAPAATAPRRLAQLRDSVLAAQVGTTGGAVLVVRHNALWLASLTGSAAAVRIAAPLYSSSAPSGYYGQVDWTGTFAWSRGVGGSGGGGSAVAFDEAMIGPAPEVP